MARVDDAPSHLTLTPPLSIHAPSPLPKSAAVAPGPRSDGSDPGNVSTLDARAFHSLYSGLFNPCSERTYNGDLGNQLTTESEPKQVGE